MALNIDEVQVYKGQLLVCDDEIIPQALGVKENKITGSAFIQGPVQIGNPDTFSEVKATLMVGPDNNDESSNPFDSLVVDGHQTINNGNLHTSIYWHVLVKVVLGQVVQLIHKDGKDLILNIHLRKDID